MLKEKISGISSISSDAGWVTVAQWNNKSELEALQNQVMPDLHVGDEFIVKQHVYTGIPGYCVVQQIKEFIQDNLTGHKVSQKLAEQYGIYGLGLRQIDYDVKCRDTLNSGYEVSIRYKVEELPTETKIGLPPLVIPLVLTIIALVALYYVIKEGRLFLKEAGAAGQTFIIAFAGLIGVVAVTTLLKNIRTTG